MIGKRVSNYTLTARLGTGSTASVYQAVHQSLDLTVAIKFLSDDLASDPVSKRRFLRGIKAVAALDHPNVCRFYEAGETDDGRLFLVMSYCDGSTLRESLRRGRCALPEALLIATLASDGLAHAHKKGVVHRDIKPANLLLSSDSVVQVADFGLAQLVDEGILTGSSEVLGTPLYMSPEQMNSEELDARTDIFSLGSVLYEMLTGKAPFAADTTVGIMRRIGMEPHTPLRELMPAAPESLCRVIDRALEKDRGRRYQRADEMRDDLRAVLDEVAPGYLESRPLPRPRRPPWTNRLRRPSWQRLSLLPAMIAAVVMGHAFEPPRNMSFVVMPPGATPDAGGEGSLLDAGLCQDLTTRLDALFADSRTHWAVPRDRAQLLKADTPESAPALLGAHHVITAAADGTMAGTAQLVRYDVNSAPLRVAEATINFGSVFDSAALDRALATLAGLARAGHTSGYTKNGDAYRAYLRGLGQLGTGDAGIDGAAASLRQAIDADSTFARAWLALAECHRRRFDATHDSTEALYVRAMCARVLSIAPGLADAHVTLGRVLASQDPAAARDEFRQALRLKPRDAVALRQLGDLDLSAGNADGAAAAYRRATDLNPADGGAWEMLGYFCYTQARYQDAVAAFERDAELAPGWHYTFNFLGACYFALDCWDRALASFEESFRLSRTYVACANLGLLYYMRHDFANAAAMYRWAREYDPTDHEMANYLAAAEYWLPDGRVRADSLYREAIVLARRDRAEKGDTPKLRAEMASLFAITGAPDSAATYAEVALRQAPKDPEIHYLVAMAYEDMGEREKALRYIASALDLGQSRKRIESEPFLDQLRKDQRYEVTVRDFPVQAGDCDGR